MADLCGLRVAARGVLLASLLAICGCTTLADQAGPLQPGLVVQFGPQMVGDWQVFAMGLCNHRPGCSYIQLERPNAFAIALTEVVDRDEKGGILTQRVSKVFVIPRKPGEVSESCKDFDGREAIVGAVDQARRRIRVFGTDGRVLISKVQAFTDKDPCSNYGD